MLFQSVVRFALLFSCLLLPPVNARAIDASLSPRQDLCNCTGLYSSTHTQCSSCICSNSLLGPKQLPDKFPLHSMVSNFDRFGSLTLAKFFDTYLNTSTGKWKYPSASGFLADSNGTSIYKPVKLSSPMMVDRFGSTNGMFTSKPALLGDPNVRSWCVDEPQVAIWVRLVHLTANALFRQLTCRKHLTTSVYIMSTEF